MTTITGTTGDDLINQGAATSALFIIADDGNDTVFAGSAGDAVLGGNGDDFINAGNGGDFVDGGNGIDTLSFNVNGLTLGSFGDLVAQGRVIDLGTDIAIELSTLVGSYVHAMQLVGVADPALLNATNVVFV